MKPQKCLVSHKPAQGFYGDCLRACVASILNLEPLTVPHFFQDGCGAVEGEKRLTDFLRSQGLGDFRVYYGAEHSLDEVLSMMEQTAPKELFYMLYCATGQGDHVVICKGNKVEHDPAWYINRNYQPTSAGYWIVSVFVRLGE